MTDVQSVDEPRLGTLSEGIKRFVLFTDAYTKLSPKTVAKLCQLNLSMCYLLLVVLYVPFL